MSGDVAGIWDHVAAGYDFAGYWRVPENHANLYHLLKHIGDPRDKDVIEVGCGSGYTSFELARRGARVSLLDISPGSLAVARGVFDAGRVPVYGCYLEDALECSLPSESFDVVWNGGVLEHFMDGRDKQRLLCEMSRLARPGGVVVVLVPNHYCIEFQLVQAVQKLLGSWPYGVEDDISPDELGSLARSAGLPVHCSYAFNPVLGWRWVPLVRRLVPVLGLDTVEHHSRESLFGFVSVLVMRKEE